MMEAGDRFGGYTVVDGKGTLVEGRRHYLVECDCGRRTMLTPSRLRKNKRGCRPCGLLGAKLARESAAR